MFYKLRAKIGNAEIQNRINIEASGNPHHLATEWVRKNYKVQTVALLELTKETE